MAPPARLALPALVLLGALGAEPLAATALPRLPAVEVSALLLIQPAGAIVWAQLLFAERLSPVQWAGVAVVLGGIAALSIWGKARRPAAPEAAVPELLA